MEDKKNIKIKDRKIDAKIIDYWKKRRLYLIGFADVSSDTINDMLKDQERDFVYSLVKSIRDFLAEHVGQLPVDVPHNFAKFINNENIRFNYLNDKEINSMINDIIGFSNTARFTSYDFFLKEFPKFYDFDQFVFVFPKNMNQLIFLEESVFEYLSDALFEEDELFHKKYFFGDEVGVGRIDSLYVINYIANDFPYIFKDEVFKERTSAILGKNKDLSEMPNVFESKAFQKSFKKKNDGTMRHVVNGINRS